MSSCLSALNLLQSLGQVNIRVLTTTKRQLPDVLVGMLAYVF